MKNTAGKGSRLRDYKCRCFILRVYTPQKIGAWACANSIDGLDTPTNWRVRMRKLFRGSTPPK